MRLISQDIFPERGYAVQVVEGDLTLIEFLQAMQALFQRDEFESSFGVIWDLRGRNLDISLSEIMELDPRFVALANQARPSGKTAWVPATQLGASIIMLLYQSHDWAQEWRTFQSVEAAAQWVERA